MNIGLLTDGKMPNIALMKISSYHKSKGDNVEWVFPLMKYDKVYISKLFKYSDLDYYCCDEVIKGGTGYDEKIKLSDEIENCDLDYSIYPDCDYSIQFFSRGCIRKCPFCLVPSKEGNITSVDPMNLNPNGKSIEVFDNNFFANSEWRQAIKYLKSKNQPVNFHGIDVRIINEEQCEALKSLKHKKQIHIAWDNAKDKTVLDGIRTMIKYIKPYKIMCYVLIGYNSTPEEDLYRVETLRSKGIDPFVMPFNKKDMYQKRFARWCNHKAIFKTVKWVDYLRGKDADQYCGVFQSRRTKSGLKKIKCTDTACKEFQEEAE